MHFDPSVTLFVLLSLFREFSVTVCTGIRRPYFYQKYLFPFEIGQLETPGTAGVGYLGRQVSSRLQS